VLNEKDIERFRRMTPDQRARIWADLTDMGWYFLRALPPGEAQRRLDLARGRRWNPPKPPESVHEKPPWPTPR
jgi:hypothetical protein